MPLKQVLSYSSNTITYKSRLTQKLLNYTVHEFIVSLWCHHNLNKTWKIYTNALGSLENLQKKMLEKSLKKLKKSNNNSKSKTIIFLKSSFDDIKKNHFTIVFGYLSKHDPNGQPQFYLHGNYHLSDLDNLVMRKNPFSLEKLAMVKTAISGVIPETLKLPKKIENELKKYQAFIKTSKSSLCVWACILEVGLYFDMKKI